MRIKPVLISGLLAGGLYSLLGLGLSLSWGLLRMVDLSHFAIAVLSAYVYSLDNKRLWSNLDCAPSNESLVKTFTPGEQVTTEVTWTGMGSEAQCPLPRKPIGPGTYNLVVQLGNLRSATVPFILAEHAPDASAPAEPPAADHEELTAE